MGGTKQDTIVGLCNGRLELWLWFVHDAFSVSCAAGKALFSCLSPSLCEWAKEPHTACGRWGTACKCLLSSRNFIHVTMYTPSIPSKRLFLRASGELNAAASTALAELVSAIPTSVLVLAVDSAYTSLVRKPLPNHVGLHSRHLWSGCFFKTSATKPRRGGSNVSSQ